MTIDMKGSEMTIDMFPKEKGSEMTIDMFPGFDTVGVCRANCEWSMRGRSTT